MFGVPVLTRRRRFGVAALTTVAVVLAALTGCGSNSPERSTKPAIPALTDAMVLTAQELPVVEGGEYHFQHVDTEQFEAVDSGAGDTCKGDWPHPSAAEAAQTAGARVRSPSSSASKGLDVALVIYDGAQPIDLAAWAAECAEQIEVPDIAPGAVVWMDPSKPGVEDVRAAGYARGVLVFAKVKAFVNTPGELNADLVTLYNRQAQKLEQF